MDDVNQSNGYVEPIQRAGRAFFQRAIKRPVVMLNLLRFRKVVDYSTNPKLAPETSISGAEAYDRCVTHTLPLLNQSGCDLMFSR